MKQRKNYYDDYIPLTGTSSRMRSLPFANISSKEFHNESLQLMNPTTYSDDYNKTEESNISTTRKCVYTYEDKYTFARILVSDSLVFDSHFESGNLHSAFRVFNSYDLSSAMTSKQHHYDLYIHCDINTASHTQWFYFSVSNIKAGQEITFSIKNFSKSDSLFNYGMRPLMYSKTQSSWIRVGTNICYKETLSSGKNCYGNVEESKKKKKMINSQMYTLQFTHVFEKSGDLCYFSYSYPYTYSDLQIFLKNFKLMKSSIKYMRRSILCKTLAGNICDILTITEPAATLQELKSRAVIIITARVHPGETNSSWIMQGILEFLLSNEPSADILRKKFIFKIIPMLNPDGVINGNYRTSLAGCDLNRRWFKPDKVLHPTIYHTKEMIRKMKLLHDVALVIDLHGHSKKEGIFIYGCLPDKRQARGPSPRRFLESDKESLKSKDGHFGNNNFDSTSSNSYYPPFIDYFTWKVKLYPRILSALSPLFVQESCNFKLHKSKASTMRMVNFIELGIDCVYTVEASLAGKFPNHFLVHDLLKFGQQICNGFLDMIEISKIKPIKETTNKYNSSLLNNFELNKIRDEIKDWKNSIIDFSVYENGCSLLSLNGLKELISAASECEGKDDDDSDIPEEVVEKEKQTKITKKKKTKKKNQINKCDDIESRNINLSKNKNEVSESKHKLSRRKSKNLSFVSPLSEPLKDNSAKTPSASLNLPFSKMTSDFPAGVNVLESNLIKSDRLSNVNTIASLSARSEKCLHNENDNYSGDGNKSVHINKIKSGRRKSVNDIRENKSYFMPKKKPSNIVQMVFNEKCGFVSSNYEKEFIESSNIFEAQILESDEKNVMNCAKVFNPHNLSEQSQFSNITSNNTIYKSNLFELDELGCTISLNKTDKFENYPSNPIYSGKFCRPNYKNTNIEF